MFQVRRALLSARGRPAPPRIEPRGLLRPANQLSTAAASRNFASASFGPKSSSKWYQEAAAVVGIVLYLHEKYDGEFSASANDQVVADLDTSMINVYIHYSEVLASMERDSEVSLVRQRLVELVHSLPSMRGQETIALDRFNDMMALHAIQEERRRGRDEGRCP